MAWPGKSAAALKLTYFLSSLTFCNEQTWFLPGVNLICFELRSQSSGQAWESRPGQNFHCTGLRLRLTIPFTSFSHLTWQLLALERPSHYTCLPPMGSKEPTWPEHLLTSQVLRAVHREIKSLLRQGTPQDGPQQRWMRQWRKQPKNNVPPPSSPRIPLCIPPSSRSLRRERPH